MISETQLELNRMYHESNLETMSRMADNSVDSIVTDPPYGLSDQRFGKKMFDVFKRSFNVVFPDLQKPNTQLVKYSDLPCVSLNGSDLGRALTFNVIKPFVSVPKSSVNLNGNGLTWYKKIEAGTEPSGFGVSDTELMDEVNPNLGKCIGNYVLDFGNAVDFSGGNIPGGDFGEIRNGFFCMPISSILSTLGPCSQTLSNDSFPTHGVNDVVGLVNNSFGEADAPPIVLASGGAENGIVLRLELAYRPGEENGTISTTDGDTVSEFVCPKIVRTLAAASSLSAKLQPYTIRLICNAANGADSFYYFHLYLPKDLLSNVQKIAETSKGFMGKKWDYDVPPVEVWKECLRVLKPGGYLLAFAGTRTQHRMAVRIEDAGFEIRDMIAWVYGSGFPKSLDVSKAIDKGAGVERGKIRVDASEARNPKATGGGRDGAAGATRPWIEAAMLSGFHEKDDNNPATPEAIQWQGWGTALKPALEPITVARKPIVGTVAANVLKWGTGGINIDGCRVGEENTKRTNGRTAIWANGGMNIEQGGSDFGRFPSNLIHDGSEEVLALFPETTSGASKPEYIQRESENACMSGKNYERPMLLREKDSGSAARFFYTAKASQSERGKGNDHPTVKPLAIMRYLCRLVTQPGGIIYDPYAGSGTTIIAAIEEGFSAFGSDLDAHHCDIFNLRTRHGIQPKMF